MSKKIGKYTVVIVKNVIQIQIDETEKAYQIELTDSGLALTLVDEDKETPLFQCENSTKNSNPVSKYIAAEKPKTAAKPGNPNVRRFKSKMRSTCPVCKRVIDIGEEIQWMKGSPAVCGDCTFPAEPPRFNDSPKSKTCKMCGKEFTYAESLVSGGDWRESYCGCEES